MSFRSLIAICCDSGARDVAEIGSQFFSETKTESRYQSRYRFWHRDRDPKVQDRDQD